MNIRARIVTFMLILLMIIIFSTNNVRSASYEWVSLSDTLPVAEIHDIAVDPFNSNYIYAINIINGVYRSINGGASWFQVNNGLEGKEIFCVLVDRKNPEILYLGSYGVYKSEDRGSSWIQLDLYVSSRVVLIEVDPNNANIIYAITEDEGIYKSEDSGKTWTSINKGLMPEYSPIVPKITDLIFDAKDPSVIYACSSEGIFKSNDGGANWEKANTGLPQKVTMKTKDPSGKEIEFEVEVTPFVYSGVIDASNPSNLYIGTDFGVFVTEDMGHNWRKLPGLAGQKVLKIVASEKFSKFMILTEKGIYESLDLCNTWKQILEIGLFEKINEFAVKFGEKEEIYLATSKGIYKSEDGGNSFFPCNKNLTYINLLHIYPSDLGDLLFLTAAGDGLYKSSDAGNSWSHLENGLENLSIMSACIDPLDNRIIYVGTDNGIFMSKDGGETFNFASDDLAERVVYTIVCIDSETIVIGTNNGIFKTKDGGITWKAANSGIDEEGYFSCTYIAIDRKNPFVIYAGTAEKGIFVSEDSGESWKSLNKSLESPYPPVNSIKIDPGKSSSIYLATEGNGLLKSEDGGENWKRLENISSPWVKDIAINQADSKNIFIVLYPPLIMESKDGGITWKDVTNNLSSKDITTVEYVGNSFIAGTKTGVYRLINTYTINASYSTGGSILPSGVISAKSGESKSFQIVPDTGYKIKDVKVDGISIEKASSYNFLNINSDHTISATFEKEVIQTVIILQVGSTTFTVNGSTDTLDSPPIIKNSRTLLPIRAVVEVLGGTVSWDAAERKVTVSLGSTTIELWIGKSIAKINGIDSPIDPANSKVVPEIINSRTMLPLRFVTENLGCDVNWDGTTKTITITYKH